MKPEAQRIAIAEACGWKYDKRTDSYKKDGETAFVGLNPMHYRLLPDYLNDLNAMHEVILSLDDGKFINGLGQTEHGFYVTMLCTITGSSMPFEPSAAQKAEAFLKAKRLWKE